VAVQVQDVGSYLCWQTYVDDAARDMGLAKLVHVGAPPDLSKIPQPEMIVPPEAFSEDLQITIPFLDSGDGADNDQTYEDGAEVSIGVADQVNHIVANFRQGPYHSSKPAYLLTSVSLDPQGADAKLSVHNLTGNADAGFTFVVHLDHINFNEQDTEGSLAGIPDLWTAIQREVFEVKKVTVHIDRACAISGNGAGYHEHRAPMAHTAKAKGGGAWLVQGEFPDAPRLELSIAAVKTTVRRNTAQTRSSPSKAQPGAVIAAADDVCVQDLIGHHEYTEVNDAPLIDAAGTLRFTS